MGQIPRSTVTERSYIIIKYFDSKQLPLDWISAILQISLLYDNKCKNVVYHTS